MIKLKTLLEANVMNKMIYNKFISLNQPERAKKFLQDIGAYGRVYDKVKDNFKRIKPSSYNLSTTEGATKYISDVHNNIVKSFPNAVTRKQISATLFNDKFKTAFDMWEHITKLILKKNNKDNLYLQSITLPKKQIKKLFEEYIGKYDNRFEVFKNPKSMKRMGEE